MPLPAYAQEPGTESMEGMESMESENTLVGIISPWVGIFALGLSLGIGFQKKDVSNIMSRLRKIIPVLSIAAGTIHLLLIQDHMAEAFEWGIFFMVTGISQIIFGFIFVKIQKKLIYYLGAVGNAIIVLIYVYVRLFAAPFAPELGPVTEIDAAGVVTDIIEVILVILLVYSLRFQKLGVKIGDEKAR